MKNTYRFMPMYWEDYSLDTVHLTTLEHGAYLLLISYYWRTAKPIPDSDTLMSKVACADLETWKSIKPTVCGFFEWVDGCWRHGRIERELECSKAISAKKRAAIAKRWSKDEHVVIQMPDRKR
jgi:uncharacterized protein YdaU (DUF1376 family)